MKSEIYIGKVISITDKDGADRIYTEIENVDKDSNLTSEKLTCPLLPKYIQVKPKVSEKVIVFTVHSSSGDSSKDNVIQRWYIGPIISQPQFMNGQDNGIALAGTNLVKGNRIPQLSRNVKNLESSEGSLGNDEDIILYGREGTDVFLGSNDIRIRCGARRYTADDAGEGLCFNSDDSAFIQMKYFPNSLPVVLKEYKGDVSTKADYIVSEYDAQNFGVKTQDVGKKSKSVVTIVGYDINLVSPQGLEGKLGNNKEKQISNTDLIDIMYNLHPLVYGDKLIEILSTMINAFLNHTHNWGPATPCREKYVKDMTKMNLNEMLSTNVRCS